MTTITADRLHITEFSVYDTSFIIELLNSPGWLQYIGDRGVSDTETALAYLMNGPMKSYNEKGFGLWLVKLRATNASIGMCGLLQREYLPHPDIGFALLPRYEGQGYAFEAANAVLRHGAEVLDMRTIMAIVTPGNEHSLRLLQKLGFAHKGPITVHDEELVSLEWNAAP
ncbi:GNAT family N-acetyltransferase [Nemorincola caseinilytica]|uniref:GNAT family N-acetyltransferase n=1 Tax=Nemorincola caseinilytica TaxID=2054315 RepID=A0ABP8NJA6_9BACT